MAQEIERKFRVVDDSYRKQAISSSRIVQGYLCTDSGRTVRIRIYGETGYLTIKGPSSDKGLSRYEWEQELSLEDAESLLELCLPGTIDKIRYLVPVGKHVFEVDEFFGDNEGLVIAEVELSQPDETFEKPSFLGEEVTGNRSYYNSRLRERPYKTW